jgi:hypothetical protein
MNTFVAALPKDQQGPFRAFSARNAHRYGDLEALYDGFEIQMERAKRGKTQETVKRAEKIIERNDAGRVSTTTREVTAADASRKREKMTGKQFDDEYDRLIAAGDHAGALALSQKSLTGKIEVED